MKVSLNLLRRVTYRKSNNYSSCYEVYIATTYFFIRAYTAIEGVNFNRSVIVLIHTGYIDKMIHEFLNILIEILQEGKISDRLVSPLAGKSRTLLMV